MTARTRSLVAICSVALAFALMTGVPAAYAASPGGGSSHRVSGTVVALGSRVVPGSGTIVTDVRLSDASGGGAVTATFTMSGGEVGGIGMWSEVFTDLSVGDFLTVGVADKGRDRVAVTAPVTVARVLGFSATGLGSAVESALSGYGWDGIHWDGAQLPVGYFVNPTGLPAGADAAIQVAAQTWEADPGSSMDYTYMGTTGDSSQALDGYNVVAAGVTDDPTALADCRYFFNTMTKHIVEFDITFNVSTYAFSTDGSPTKYDLQTVGTHELGHTLSLVDLYESGNSAQVMYGYCSKGDTGKRVLAAGDIAGIRAIYPAAVATSTLSGTVTSSAGGALAGVSVAVGGVASGTTNANGAYTISGIPAGSYNVAFTRSGYSVQSRAVDLTTSKTVSLALTPLVTTVTLSGTVTSCAGGALAGASVAVGGVASGTTNANGVYSISGIPAGSYNVTFTRSGYSAQSRAVDLTTSETVSLALTPLVTTVTLTGTVTSSDGGALAGASVAVGGVASGTTDANGAYSIPGIVSGSYTVTYSRSGYVPQSLVVDLSVSRSRSFALAPVDSTPPVTTSDVQSSYVGSATVHLNAADNGGSGVAHTYYRLDGAAQVEGTSVTVSDVGTHTLEFWSADVRGNVETPVAATFAVSASHVTPPPVIVRIPTRLTITSNRTSVTHRHPVYFSGTISSTQPQNTHVVVWAKRPGSNHWDKLSVRHTTSGHRWYYTYSPATRGTWYFRVRFAATATYAASVSPSRRIVVR